MIFEEQAVPRMEDYGRNGELTLDGVLRLFESVANHHSTSVQDNVMEGSQQGVTWILTEWQVRLLQPVDFRVNGLRAATWGRTCMGGSMVHRDYTLKDASGALVAAGTSNYVLMDLAHGRLLRVTPELMERYHPDEAEALPGAETARMREHSPAARVLPIALRRSDIDFNAHVHNLSYLAFALEALPEEVYRAAHYNSLRLSYRKAILEGEAVEARYAPLPDGAAVSLYANGTLRALTELREL